jgi:hypothetical protein
MHWIIIKKKDETFDHNVFRQHENYNNDYWLHEEQVKSNESFLHKLFHPKSSVADDVGLLVSSEYAVNGV